MTRQSAFAAIIVLIAAAIGLGIFFLPRENSAPHDDHTTEAYERGPHRGRLLREGDFAVEITIFEDGVPPEYRAYATEKGKPIATADVQLTVSLKRLDGEINTFRFAPMADFLRGDGVVEEPHSFDVMVTAAHKGKTYKWAYASYEGRTTIANTTAAAAGVKAEAAGAGTIATIATLTGRIGLEPSRSAQARARFPGIVRDVRKTVGDAVQAGEVLALVESNESLQPYQVRSPITGRVTHRAVNAGEATADRVLFEIVDTSSVVAEFHVFPRHSSLIKEGQPVTVLALDGGNSYEGQIEALSFVADPASQSTLARVRIANPEGTWRPGIAVTGRVTVNSRDVPLAVKNSGLQAFRDFTVVYAKVGDTYEVRMLELGDSDGEHTEVLSGLKPGTTYVYENSFLIKSDIEKSGASHDH